MVCISLTGGLAIALMIGFLVFLNSDGFRKFVEKNASQASQMDVQINGNFDVRTFPNIDLKANDIQVTKDGTLMVQLDHLRIRAQLLPLLIKRIHLTEVVVKDATVFVYKSPQPKNIPVLRSGNLPSSTAPAPQTAAGIAKSTDRGSQDQKLAIRDLWVDQLKINNGAMVLYNQQGQVETRINGLNLSVGRFEVIEGHRLKADDIESVLKRFNLKII